jgi:hypothetical protein
MLDAASCSGMELGEPRASLAALTNLYQLLTEIGFRPSSYGDFHTDNEEQDDPSTTINSDAAIIPHRDGSTPTEHFVRGLGARGNEPRPPSQRNQSTGHLAPASSRRSITGGEQ